MRTHERHCTFSVKNFVVWTLMWGTISEVTLHSVSNTPDINRRYRAHDKTLQFKVNI